MSCRNILLILVFTLILYDGLNHMIFLLRFLLGGGVDGISMVSLKPLILSALSNYSLLQDISDIILLTIDGICVVIVDG